MIKSKSKYIEKLQSDDLIYKYKLLKDNKNQNKIKHKHKEKSNKIKTQFSS